MAGLSSDMLQVFLFIIIFVIIHIIIVNRSSRNLKVTLKQRILIDDGLPVIKLRSATRDDIEKSVEHERRETEWETLDTDLIQSLLTPLHLKFSPVDDWPSSLDNDERWLYFMQHCAIRNNISQDEITTCAMDSGTDAVISHFLQAIANCHTCTCL